MKAMVSESPDMNRAFDDIITGIEYKIKDVDIASIVLEHLKKLNLAKTTSRNKMMPRTDRFSVSQCSYDCYRKIYFEMQYPKQVDNSDSLGRFTMGDIIDSIMKGAFEGVGGKSGVFEAKEYYDNMIKIQGEPDTEFSDLIIETKSVSPFAWKYIVGGKDKVGNIIIGKPKIQHIRQINTYLDIKGIDNGVIVYVNKDNFQIKPYPIKYSADLMIQTVGRCATVFNAINEKRVPTKHKGDECTFCHYKDKCKECV